MDKSNKISSFRRSKNEDRNDKIRIQLKEYENIQSYIKNNSLNKSIVNYLDAVTDTVLQKIDKLLFILKPNLSSLKDLISMISDLESSKKEYGFAKVLDLAKNSGLKTTLKFIKKTLMEISPLIPTIKEEVNTKETGTKIVKQEFKGDFLKQCPCTPDAIHCGYKVLSPAFGCKFNCSYCFLNFYQENRNEISLFTNTDKIIKELINFSKKQSSPVRIGTGEFTDSFAIDNLNSINEKLLDILPSIPNIVLEFKSKSNNVDVFTNYPNPPRNAVISWSINPQRIIDLEEDKTISLNERIDLMSKISKKYFVGIHFDPMFMEEELLPEYLDTIEKIFAKVPPKKAVWVSLGGYRFTEDLKINSLKNNNGYKWYFGRYFEKSWDNKFRYPEKHRVDFYKSIARKIKEFGDIKIYMCMESAKVWEQTKPEIDIKVLSELPILPTL